MILHQINDNYEHGYSFVRRKAAVNRTSCLGNRATKLYHLNKEGFRPIIASAEHGNLFKFYA